MDRKDLLARFYGRVRHAGAFIKEAIRADGWFNTFTGLGVAGVDKLMAAQMGVSPLLTPGQLEILYSNDDLAARMVDAPIEHALMQGWEVPDDEDDLLSKAAKRWKAHDLITKGATWGRLYGGGALLLGVDGQGDMADPLDVQAIREGQLLYVTDLERQHFHPYRYYNEPGTARYGEVRTYLVSKHVPDGGGFSGIEVHESRLLRFGGTVTTHQYKQANNGFDLSVLQRVYDTLRDTNSSFQSFYRYLNDLSQAVFKINGLMEMIAEGQKEELQTRMELVQIARSAARAVLLDADGEDFQQIGTANATGLPPAMDKVMQRLAAAAQMPVTVLMGMSPAGLNATGDSDMRSWFNTVRVARERYIQGPLQDLLTAIALSEGVAFEGEIVTITWPSLWQMAPTEEAELQVKHATRDKLYIDSGVIEPEEVTIGRFSNGTYSHEIAHAVDTDMRNPPDAPRIKDPTEPEPIEPTEPEPTEPEPTEAPEDKIQQTALNGAQVKALQDLAIAVSEGTLPKDSARAIIAAAFPAVPPETVAQILEPIEEGGSEPAPPPPMIPGQSPPPPPGAEPPEEDEDAPKPPGVDEEE